MCRVTIIFTHISPCNLKWELEKNFEIKFACATNDTVKTGIKNNAYHSTTLCDSVMCDSDTFNITWASKASNCKHWVNLSLIRWSYCVMRRGEFSSYTYLICTLTVGGELSTFQLSDFFCTYSCRVSHLPAFNSQHFSKK